MSAPELATFARDMHLLRELPRTDSPKANAMIYDHVVAAMGQPGVGYDPVAVFHAGQAAWRTVNPMLEAADSAGFQAAKTAGWY